MHSPLISPSSTNCYRSDIDGLRAIAVLSVLVFHYNGEWILPGGFAGVDVFFVISGYLITSRLAAEINAGTFSVLAFYDRRARRIMPALLVMLATMLLLGRFFLVPGDYQSLAGSAAAAAFGVSNFFFLANTGYFDQVAKLLPLLHTWSLAVEEQFYLVWPFLLLFAAAGRARSDVAAIVGTLIIASFGGALVWHDLDPKAVFFMALPRAWELLAGAVLVFLPQLPRRLGEAAVVVGTAAIGASLFVIREAAPTALLVPCIGSALILWPRSDRSIAAQGLGVIAPLGLISYSLYLWHWPIWVFFRIYINSGTPGPRETATLAALSILIAALSYRYIEQPFRRPRLAPVRTVWMALAASTAVSCAAMYIHSTDGLPGRLPRDHYAMRSLEAMWQWPCQELPAPNYALSCTFGAPWRDGVDKAALWGDSNAAHFTPMIERVAIRDNVAVAARSVCSPVLSPIVIYDVKELGPAYNPTCQNSNAHFIEFLQTNAEIKTVILAASWESQVRSLKGRGSNERIDGAALLERALADVVGKISAPGRQIVVIAQIPHWPFEPIPRYLQDIGVWRRSGNREQTVLPASFYRSNNQRSFDALRSFSRARPDVRLMMPGDVLCLLEQCTTIVNGEFVYRDATHFRRNLTEPTNEVLAMLLGFDRLFKKQPLSGNRQP